MSKPAAAVLRTPVPSNLPSLSPETLSVRLLGLYRPLSQENHHSFRSCSLPYAICPSHIYNYCIYNRYMHILILLLILTSPVSALEQHICDEIAVVLADAVESGTLTELEDSRDTSPLPQRLTARLSASLIVSVKPTNK